MDSTPQQGKKQKVDDELTPECELCFSTQHAGYAYKKRADSIEQRLKKWGLDKEFTIHDGGSRLGCITCMKFGAWWEQEGANIMKWQQKKQKKKQKKKKEEKEQKEKKETKEKKAEKEKKRPAEADSSSSDETTHADVQHALQNGTYKHEDSKRLKYILERHLSGGQHKNAACARENVEQEQQARVKDVPTDAQMLFVYDEVKKSPMVLNPSPCFVAS